jgi:hypothetical protein
VTFDPDWAEFSEQELATLKKRLTCHTLVAALPGAALEEASEALADVADYWLSAPGHAVPLLPRETHEAEVTRDYKRPTFRIGDE